MALKSSILKIIATPRKVLLLKFFKKIIAKSQDKLLFEEAKLNTTYSELPGWLTEIKYSCLFVPDVRLLMKFKNEIYSLADNFIHHKFRILSPNWSDSFYGFNPNNDSSPSLKNIKELLIKSPDLINSSNLLKSKEIYELILDDYLPIDWQLDFSSGYRWDSKIWYKHLNYGNITGVEVKIPWEIGRLQHLIVLIYGIILLKHENDENLMNLYFTEYKNIILDFIASNPPGFGIQWKTTMDVSIRLVSLLFSYDMAKNTGLKFNDDFNNIFFISIHDHLLHIVKNLEYSSGMRGNHYLFDLAGLLFASSYLPESDETNYLLAFSINEIQNEINYQFNPDGSNFEASTCYHFYTSEMLFVCLYMIQSLPPEKIKFMNNLKNTKNPFGKYLKIKNKCSGITFKNNELSFSESFKEQIHYIAQFCFDLVDTEGEIPQIGDNDSGRFIKFNPMDFFKSFSLYQCPVLALYGFISNDDNFLLKFDNLNYNFEILNSILKKPSDDNKSFLPVDNPQLDTNNNILLIKKENFGVYIYKSEVYRITVRCGDIGQKGKGGHAHNDELSITLDYSYLPFLVDPGTFCYTSYPDLRNLYRSSACHNTLSVTGMEQNLFFNEKTDDLFWLFNKSKPKIIQAEETIFYSQHFGFGKPHNRKIKFSEDKIEIFDECDVNADKFINLHLHPKVQIEEIKEYSVILAYNNKRIEIEWDNGELKIEHYFYSPGYGIQVRSHRLKIIMIHNVIKWTICFL